MTDHKMVVNPDIDLDQLQELEEQFAREQGAEGYRQGCQMGKKAGETEGLALGAAEGAKKGSELGYLHGYTMTYKQLYACDQDQSSSSSITKSKKLFDEILHLIDEYPRTNSNDCDDKLDKIRLKFRQAFANIPGSHRFT